MNDDLLPQIRPLPGDARLIPAASATAMRALAAERPADTCFCAHTGSSMNPTLGELDLLELVTYGEGTPRAGDVILFLPPEGEKPVVHRVVSVGSRGMRTRGDNGTHDDPYLVHAADVAGRVVAAWRGQQRRRIAGGPAGWLGVHLRRWGRVLDRGISRLLHPFYYALAGSGAVQRLVPARLRPRAVAFRANDQSHLRLMMGRWVVGYYEPRQGQWQIRRPCRLFVDAGALPRVRATDTTPARPVQVSKSP